MTRQIFKGTCTRCASSLDKRAVWKHVDECKGHAITRTGARTRRVLDILVEGGRNREYWLHVECPADSTLADLDQLLRDTWVECCGHPSAFVIDRVTYAGEDSLEGRRSMKARLGDVLNLRMAFRYEYDFGSTTELVLRIACDRVGPYRGTKPRVAARNDPPEFACVSCGEPAAQICTECSQDEASWLCRGCDRDHDCESWSRLPIVNSPRVGVCGYGG